MIYMTSDKKPKTEDKLPWKDSFFCVIIQISSTEQNDTERENTMKMKRFTAISALLCTLLLSLGACGGGSDTTDVQTDNTQASVTEAVTVEESDGTEYLSLLPEGNFEGEQMRFLSRASTDTVVRYYSEVMATETNGETMNDAIYERTQRLEERYGVTFVEERVDGVSAIYQKSYMAGEDNWDVIVDSIQEITSRVVSNPIFMNLNDIPVDLTQLWWDVRVTDNLAIAGRRYVTIGAINNWTDSHTYGIVFNKELAANYDLDLYAMVDNNEWTLDRFAEILKLITADADGDGDMDEKDRYGAMGAYDNFGAFIVGCNLNIVQLDKDGYPRYNIDDRLITAATKIYEFMRGGDTLLANEYLHISSDPWTDVIRVNFRAGNSLFGIGSVEQLQIFRNMETPIGLLPMPKYDTSLDYAHGFSYYWSSAIAVPASNTKPEMTGILLEALNIDAYHTTKVAFYETVLEGKGIRDEESIRMLDIIRSTRDANFEDFFNYLNLNSIFNSLLQNRSIEKLTSSIESGMAKAEAKIEKSFANILAEE